MALDRPGTTASARGSATATSTVFLAASYADRRFAERLARDLRTLLGGPHAVTCETRGSKVGSDPLWNEVRQGIAAAPTFLVVLSPEALASKWVNDEIDQAFQLLGTRPERKIIPIIWRPCKLRPDVSLTQVVRFAPPRAYGDGFADLTRALGMSSVATSVPNAPATGAYAPRVTRRTFLIGTGATLVVAAAAAEALHAGLFTASGSSTIAPTTTWPQVTALPGTTLALANETIYASVIFSPQSATSASLAPGAYVYALDTTAHTQQSISVEPNLISYYLSAPATDGSRVYVLSNSIYGDEVHALDAASGTQAWSYPLTTDGTHFLPPTVANGQVAALAHSPKAVFLSTSGAGGSLVWSTASLTGDPVAGPVVAGTLLYASFATKSDGNVYALALANGAAAQTYPLHAPPTTAPTVTTNALYVAAGKNIIAFAPGKPSAPLWTATTRANVINAIAATGSTVYACDSAGTVYALDATTGKQHWAIGRQASINAAPVLSPTGDRLYIASDQPAVYALSPATGGITATYALGAKPVTTPILSPDGKHLYIGAANGVYGFTTA